MKKNMLIGSAIVLVFVIAIFFLRNADAFPKGVSTTSLAGAANVTVPIYFVQPAENRIKQKTPAEIFSENSWQMLSDRAMPASIQFLLTGERSTLGMKNYEFREKLAVRFFENQKDIPDVGSEQFYESIDEPAVTVDGSIVNRSKYLIQTLSNTANGSAYKHNAVVVTDPARKIRIYLKARAEWYSKEVLETQAISIMDSIIPNPELLDQYFAKVKLFNLERASLIKNEAPEFEKEAQVVVRLAQAERSKYFSDKLNWTKHSDIQKKHRLDEIEALFTDVDYVLDKSYVRWKSGDVVIYDFDKKIVYKDKTERRFKLSIEKEGSKVRFSDLR